MSTLTATGNTVGLCAQNVVIAARRSELHLQGMRDWMRWEISTEAMIQNLRMQHMIFSNNIPIGDK